eukprot:386197-Hanusia_phi.AAC.1
MFKRKGTEMIENATMTAGSASEQEDDDMSEAVNQTSMVRRDRELAADRDGNQVEEEGSGVGGGSEEHFNSGEESMRRMITKDGYRMITKDGYHAKIKILIFIVFIMQIIARRRSTALKLKPGSSKSIIFIVNSIFYSDHEHNAYHLSHESSALTWMMG